MAQELSDLGIIAIHNGERILVHDICTSFIQAHPLSLHIVSTIVTV